MQDTSPILLPSYKKNNLMYLKIWIPISMFIWELYCLSQSLDLLFNLDREGRKKWKERNLLLSIMERKRSRSL